MRHERKPGKRGHPIPYEEHLSRSKFYVTTNGGKFKTWYPATKATPPEEAYKLHIPIRTPEYAPVIAKEIGAILRKNNVPHKIVSSIEELNNQSRSAQAGKAITAYPANDAELVKLAKNIDKKFLRMGIVDTSPIGRPLGSRGIGKSGQVFYRYSTNNSSFRPRNAMRYDEAHGWIPAFNRYSDLRLPFHHKPFSGEDKIEELARKKKLPVEDKEHFLWQAGQHLDHLILQAEVNGDELELGKLLDKKESFNTLRQRHDHDEAPTHRVSADERKAAVISSDFMKLYNDIRKNGLVVDSSGIEHSPEYMIDIIREHFEGPMINGKSPSRKDLTYLTSKGYAPRAMVRRLLDKYQ